MTVQEAKNKLIAWCRAQVGYSEGSNNWNKFAQDRYGAYGWNVQNQPWCDIFTDVGFIDNFGLTNAAAMTYQPVGAFSAKCSISADYFKKAKAWYSAPEVGDVAFFYYSGLCHPGSYCAVRSLKES